MGKVQAKHEYFHKGVDNQKTPDCVVDLRRPEAKTIEKYGLSCKLGLASWLESVKTSFAAYVKEIEDIIY